MIRRSYLAIVGGLWLLIFLFGVAEVAAGADLTSVRVAGYVAAAGFAAACIVVAMGYGRASRLGILALASGLPLWLGSRLTLVAVRSGDWDALLVVVLGLVVLLVVVPFGLIAHALWGPAGPEDGRG